MERKEEKKREIFEKVQKHQISIDKAYELIKEINENYDERQINPDQLLHYQSEWIQKELESKYLKASHIEPLIIFDFQGGISDRLFASGILEHSETVIVCPGQAFLEKSKKYFIIDPESTKDYVELFSALLQQGIFPKTILNLWPICNGKIEDIKLTDTEELLKSGIFATFHTLKAIHDLKLKSVTKYMVVLNTEKNVVNPFFEAIKGFAGSLNISMPNLAFSTFEAGFDDADMDPILNAIINELSVQKFNIPYVVKWEQNKRYIRNIVKADLNANQQEVMLKTQGVYLITGGTGGLGLVFARYLAGAYQAKLILTGRSPLNINKETVIDDIRKTGAEVLYLQADVGNLQDMKRVRDTITEQFGALNGIFHVGGLNSITNLFKKDINEFKSILWPKIQGTVVLDAVTKDIDLDFLLLFSSVASVLGDFGQGDYAVGNRFIDGFINYREALRKVGKRKGVTKGINWPLWREGGMHLAKESEALYLQSAGMSYLENEEGIKILESMLSGNQNHLIPIKGAEDRIQRMIDKQNSGKEITSAANKEVLKRKVFKSSAPSQLTLEQRISYDINKLASDILKIDISKLDVNENIGSYGFDSISLKEFADKLSELFQVDVTPVIFFDLSTLKDICRFFLNEYNNEINELYQLNIPLSEEPSIISNQDAARSDELKTEGYITTSNAKNRGDVIEKEPIAVIGISGIFPGSDDLEAYWENLICEKDLITEIPLTRWDWKTYEAELKDKYEKFSKWGGFINDIDAFDAKFFNISPKEAEYMDPQQRIFLETVWKTIEDAGYKASDLSGRDIGVFVGVQPNEYNELVASAGIMQPQQVTGNANTLISNRISFVLNFRGPSEAIDTACSSSLVALNRAVKSIQCGECEMALAGGISLMISPNVFIGAIKLGVLSTDGRCKTFDKSANGYVRGEGAGCVLLKPLSKAIADKDPIHGVIKGIAEGHGGKANSLTAPNSDAQANLLIRAYRDADLSPETLTYIEAHGTGTELGDPVEIQGLKKAFNRMVNKQNFSDHKFCGIGSVKTNIGHLEPASGIASLLKVILCMKHKILPANLHFKELNPYIDLEETPFYILNQTKSWERKICNNGGFIPRRAGISSFGFGGAGVHAIMEEYDVDNEVTGTDTYETHVIILSAKQQDQLKCYAAQLMNFLSNVIAKSTNDKGHRNYQLNEIAYTLQTGRESMSHRMAIKTGSIEQLIDDLKAYVDGKAQENIITGCVKDHTISTLLDGSYGQEFIKNTLAAHDMDRLIQLWINGVDIDWRLLYIHQPKKVSLPTYPFAKERYWITGGDNTQKNHTSMDKQVPFEAQDNSAHEEEIMYCTYEWEKGESISGLVHKSFKRLLLFDSNRNLGDALDAQYSVDEFEVIHVHIGETYEEISQREYILNPLYKEDFCRLFLKLSENKQIPTHILWYASDCQNKKKAVSLEEYDKPETLLSNSNLMVHNLVNLCSSLFETDWEKSAFKLLFTYHLKGLHHCPEYDSINSLLKTVCLENARINYKVISFDLNNDADAKAIAPLLLTELDDDDKEILYRENERYIKRMEVIDNFTNAARSRESLIKEAGVYLITGGMGGLGFIFAEYLVKYYNVQLVLTGRSELSFEKQEMLSGLKKYNNRVLYIRSDISDREAVKSLIDEVKRRFGEINGIIHAAGIIRDAYIINKTDKDISEVLLPKTNGTIWLDEMTKDEQLDFFVCFSSIAAVLGNPGQADYAYANSFMDAFMKKRAYMVNGNKRFGKSISINWPLWRDGGMQVNHQIERMLGERFGFELMASQMGIDAFENILKQDENQVSVFYGNKKKIMGLFNNRQASTVKSNYKIEDDLKDKQFIQTFKKECVELASQILNMEAEDMDLEEEMSSFGYDSLSFTEFSNRLKDKYNIDVMPAIFYEYKTMQLFIQYLTDEYAEQLQKHYSENTAFKVFNKVELINKVEAEPIAIVGINGIMPGADNLQAFWENIEAGKDMITEIPGERWNWKEIYGNPAMESNKTNIKWGGFIKDVDKFDPGFFGLSMDEAALMDPQQRIMLETAWKAIEDAGYNTKDLSDSKTGVFIGVGVMDYGDVLHEKGIEIHAGISTGMSHSIVANRISYLLNLRGPSEPIDTACASALYAVHRAVEEIQLGHCEAAVVGAIKVILSPTLYIAFSKAGMLSEDGRCKTFDQAANGYVRGEGAGALFLKPLSKAISDGDHIYALIKGSAVNHGGHVYSMTTPNPNAQADVIVNAWKKAGIDPSTIGYIEAHGAGTPIGDVIEVNAMKKAFKQLYKEWNMSMPNAPHCGIGSVKTNIGHLETAAGMAGLLKVILAIKNRKIPASINIKNINPDIRLEGSPLYIADATKEWDTRPGEVRRAGVSAFGYGGVNTHIVLEEYDPNVYEQAASTAEEKRPDINDDKNINSYNSTYQANADKDIDALPQIITLSAKDQERLIDYAKAMVDFLEGLSLPSNITDLKERLVFELKKIAADIIYVTAEALTTNESLLDFGFDPVSLSEFSRRIVATFRITESPPVVLAHMTIDYLAKVLIQQYYSKIGKYFGTDTKEFENDKDICLRNIAYTLQVGRDEMSERLAIVTSDIMDLREKLISFIRGKENIKELYYHSYSKKSRLKMGGEDRECLDYFTDNTKVEEIAAQWASGKQINWQKLYCNCKGKRLSLPTYPFAKESCWITSKEKV